MFKRVTIFILLSWLILSIGIPLHVSAAGSIEFDRKIVSVVYDDSGSMCEDEKKNWAYANYAMQAFTALMNENDKLFITCMSSVEENDTSLNPTIDLGHKERSVKSIREHDSFISDDTNTPFSAIKTAYEKLTSAPDNKQSTRYWLVIMTDGQFQDENQGDLKLSKLNQTLSSYADSEMPNGSKLLITFLAIGDIDKKFTPEPGNNITVKSTSDGKDIFSAISEIADQVSGRIRLSKKQISQVNNRTIAVSSSIPLVKIAVLTQNSAGKLDSVKVDQGDKLHVEQAISITYPPAVKERVTDESLNGSVTLVDNKDENIPSGKYILEFSKDVSADDIDIMFEPAINMKIIITRMGKVITDPSILRADDIIDIQCKFYIKGTDTEISGALLPSFEKTGLYVFENDDQKYGGSQLALENIKLKQLKTKISAFAEISQYVRFTDEVVFAPQKPVVYGLMADPANKDMVLLRCDFKHGTKGPRFIITADGKPVTRIEAENLLFTYTVDKDVKFTLVYKDDGSIVLLPKSKWPLICIPTGEIALRGVLNNKIAADTTFKIGTTDWLCVILNLLIPILVALFIIGIIIKKRFPHALIIEKSLTRSNGVNSETETDYSDVSPWTQWYIPYFAARKQVGDCTFVAGGRKKICVSRQSLKSNGQYELSIDDKSFSDYFMWLSGSDVHRRVSLGSNNLYVSTDPSVYKNKYIVNKD